MSSLDFAVEQVAAPAAEPLSVDEARNHARVDLPDDDGWIARAITASRKWCEDRSGRAFVTQTCRLWLPRFPRGGVDAPFILVPKPRLQSVASIQYVDSAGDLQTLDAGEYVVESRREPGMVVPAYGRVWPSVREVPGSFNAVRVEFVCGYGTPAQVDERAKQAMLMLMAHWYRNRETVAIGAASGEIELSVSALLYQLWDGVLR